MPHTQLTEQEQLRAARVVFIHSSGCVTYSPEQILSCYYASGYKHPDADGQWVQIWVGGDEVYNILRCEWDALIEQIAAQDAAELESQERDRVESGELEQGVSEVTEKLIPPVSPLKRYYPRKRYQVWTLSTVDSWTYGGLLVVDSHTKKWIATFSNCDEGWERAKAIVLSLNGQMVKAAA